MFWLVVPAVGAAAGFLGFELFKKFHAKKTTVDGHGTGVVNSPAPRPSPIQAAAQKASILVTSPTAIDQSAQEASEIIGKHLSSDVDSASSETFTSASGPRSFANTSSQVEDE